MKKILYTFLFILTFTVLLCFSAAAVDTVFEANSINWKVSLTDFDEQATYGDTIADGSATITGIDETEYTKDGFKMPSFVTYEGKTYVVTTIKNDAFKDNRNLVFGNVEFPNYLTTIGTNAFYRTRIYGELDIPNGVTTISSGAFRECKGIISVKLPAGITSIDSNAFRNCYSLTKVEIRIDVEEGEEAPIINIPNFGSECFYQCFALQSVPLGAGTTAVGSSAFYECKALESIDLSTLNALGSSAFANCANIEEIIMPNAIAFSDTVSALNGLPNVKKYIVDSKSSYYSVESGVLYNKDKTVLYRYPITKKDSSFTVPNSVTEIYSEAFCVFYKDSSVESLKNGIYYGAENLRFIKLNSSLTKIGNRAFCKSGLETFFAPDTVTEIGSNVLDSCPNLTWVVLGSQIKSASNIVANSANVKFVIGRNASFTTTGTGVPSTGKAYAVNDSFVCPNHFYAPEYFDDSINPTCTESGLNVCVACGDKIYARPLGHVGPVIEESQLSCTTDEYIVIDCTRCGLKVKEVSRHATGHTAGDNKPIVSNPTATAPGYKVIFCTTCNQTVVYDYSASLYLIGDVNADKNINAKDVTYLGKYLGGQALVINKLAADLNKDSVVDVYDLILLKRFVEEIDTELPSSDAECQRHLRINTAEHILNKGDSCTQHKIYVSYCLDCGKLLGTEIEEFEGHDWQYKRGLESTCSIQGFARYECSKCKKFYEENFELSDHSGSWWTMPDKKGYEYRSCENCGLFQSREVDYTEFDALIAQLSPNYELYYSQQTLDLLNPIINNYKNSVLTQELVDKNVELLKSYIPRIKYKVGDVPAVFITTDGTTLTKRMDYIWAELAVAYYDENGNYVNFVDANGQMRLRGNSTAGHAAKQPYNIKFSANLDLLGLGKDNKYCLLSNAFDPAFIRNGVARELNKAILADYTCDYEYVEVYYNGTYKGAYMLCTPVDIEETRIDLDENDEFILEIEYDAGDVKDNGALYVKTPYTNFRVKIDSHDVEDITADGYASVYSVLMQADFALMSGDWKQVEKYFDIDNLVKYYVIHEYLKDVDYAWDSTRFCIDNGKITAGPAWDFDRSMGHSSKSGGNANCRDAYYNSTSKPSIGGVEGDSTTGTWANVIYNGIPNEQWINNPTNTGSGNNDATNWDRQNGNHNWFTFLYLYYPEFVAKVSDCIWELQDELAHYYKDTYDEIGNRTINYIDKVYNDTAVYDLIIENFKMHMVWDNTDKTNYLNSAEGFKFKSWAEALTHLRDWLEGRHQWMLEFYCAERLAVQNSDLILKNKEINSYYKSTTTRSYEMGGVLIYEVKISSISASDVDAHAAAMYELIAEEFSIVSDCQIEFYYDIGASTPMTYINGEFTIQ